MRKLRKKPAQFFCETCPGHLCESCKSEHEGRKISQNHIIIHLTLEKGDILERLYCSKHRNKKLICYCSPCQIPVCNQCMMESHYGHKVGNLATFYKELQKEKEEIKTTLLPKYEDLLGKGEKEKAYILKKTDKVQRQIEDHTERLIQRYTAMKERRLQVIRQSSEDKLKSVESYKTEIEKRIKILKEIESQISSNLGARPGIVFFKAMNRNSLSEIRQYPDLDGCKLHSFSPGDIEKITQDTDFGDVPKFRSTDPLGLFRFLRTMSNNLERNTKAKDQNAPQ